MRKKVVTLIIMLIGLSCLAIGLTINEIVTISEFYLRMVPNV